MSFRFTAPSVAALALALVLPAFSPTAALAQAELTGTYIRYFGVRANGSFINSSNHSMQYTETGSTPYSCDAFYPGSPVEGFTVQATAGSTPIAVTNGYSGSGITTTSGPTVSGRQISWSGSYASGSAAFSLNQVVRFESAARSAQVTVTMTNTGSVTLSNVYYLRDADPDFGSCSIGTATETTNDVRRQPPGASSAIVTSRAGSPSLVLAMATADTRARAHADGFDNTEAATIWAAPVDPGLTLGDVSIDLVWRHTSLAVGASTTFTWYYVWGSTEASVESRFDALAPGCGADGSSCSGGTCRGGSCCTGCWDGVSCQTGTSASTCGSFGGLCTSCFDGNDCTTDSCSSGACNYPAAPSGTFCDDGQFCTESDSCSAGSCRGVSRSCDDFDSCTSDRCDESVDRCVSVADRCVDGGGMMGTDGGPVVETDGGPVVETDGGGVVVDTDGGMVIPMGDGGSGGGPSGRTSTRRSGCSVTAPGGPASAAPARALVALLALLALGRRRRR